MTWLAGIKAASGTYWKYWNPEDYSRAPEPEEPQPYKPPEPLAALQAFLQAAEPGDQQETPQASIEVSTRASSSRPGGAAASSATIDVLPQSQRDPQRRALVRDLVLYANSRESRAYDLYKENKRDFERYEQRSVTIWEMIVKSVQPQHKVRLTALQDQGVGAWLDYLQNIFKEDVSMAQKEVNRKYNTLFRHKCISNHVGMTPSRLNYSGCLPKLSSLSSCRRKLAESRKRQNVEPTVMPLLRPSSLPLSFSLSFSRVFSLVLPSYAPLPLPRSSLPHMSKVAPPSLRCSDSVLYFRGCFSRRRCCNVLRAMSSVLSAPCPSTEPMASCNSLCRLVCHLNH